MLEKEHTAFIEEETTIFNIIKKAIEVQIEESCVAFHNSSSSRRNLTRSSHMDSDSRKDSNGYAVNSCYKDVITESQTRASNPVTPLKGAA